MILSKLVSKPPRSTWFLIAQRAMARVNMADFFLIEGKNPKETDQTMSGKLIRKITMIFNNVQVSHGKHGWESQNCYVII